MPNWQELEKKYFMSTFKRSNVVIARGEGNRVWDDEGKEYLDFWVAGQLTFWGTLTQPLRRCCVSKDVH